MAHILLAASGRPEGVPDNGSVRDLRDIRRSYTRGRLDEQELASTWHEQLRRWFDEAMDMPELIEANAIQVATVDPSGRPDVRTVLCRGLDERGVVFYTNYTSAKGRQLLADPRAAVLFGWLPLERQVRLSGVVEQVTRAETEDYWNHRPRGSQVASAASPQSSVLRDRAELEERVRRTDEQFAGQDVPAPPEWGGFRLLPDSVEFWQGRDNRLHDRLRFRLVESSWVVERLAP
jgi:pyridoxamine 5'-phosphate oxidase